MLHLWTVQWGSRPSSPVHRDDAVSLRDLQNFEGKMGLDMEVNESTIE